MSRRLLTILLSLAAFAVATRASELAPVRYTIRLPEAKSHYAEVEAAVPSDGQNRIELFLPVWTPGSYLVREFAQHVDRVTATAEDGSPLAVEKTLKNRWVVASNGRATVRLHYRLYGGEPNIRANWIEPDFAFLNGAATFLTVAGRSARPYEVSVELPAGWRGVYTALAPTADPSRFTAPDYDTLVDSPLLAGSPQVDSFDIDGVPHVLVTVCGDGVWDNARAARSFSKLAQAQRDFWGFLPSRQPFYFFNLLTGSRGGIEHRQGFALMADRWLSRTTSGMTSWLSLASHEYFHLWNGKRLRPVALGPFDYEHEVYTDSLWAVEGITNYYQQLLNRRAGINTRAEYLASLGRDIASVEDTPGRFVQSLAEASFDAWIKAYRPDENSINTTVSYYNQGAVAALLLDTEIRRTSHGARSLDDVLRLAFSRYSGAAGYTDAQFAALASEVAGAELSDWVHRAIDSSLPSNYQPFLDWFGLAFETSPPKPADPDDSDAPNPRHGWLGAETKIDAGRLVVTKVRADTPAYKAGLSTADEIVGLDDYRVRPDQLATRLNSYRAGEKVTLLIARLDRLIRLEVTLGEDLSKRWKLAVRKDATPAQTAHLDAWLGSEPKSPAEKTGS